MKRDWHLSSAPGEGDEDRGGKPMTYAGGVHSYEDLELLKKLGRNRLNVTIGSALDLFGGALSWEKVSEMCKSD